MKKQSTSKKKASKSKTLEIKKKEKKVKKKSLKEVFLAKFSENSFENIEREQLGEMIKRKSTKKISYDLSKILKHNGLKGKLSLSLDLKCKENLFVFVDSNQFSSNEGIEIKSPSEVDKKLPQIFSQVRDVAIKSLNAEFEKNITKEVEEVNKAIEKGDLDAAFIRDLRNQTYHMANGVSSSDVKVLYNETLSHFKVYKNNKFNSETKSKNNGSAFHSLLLEPANFKKEFYVTPELDKRKHKVAFEILEMENFSKTAISETDFKDMERKVSKIKKNENIQKILESSEKEISFFLKVGDHTHKARIDILTVVTQDNIGVLEETVGSFYGPLVPGDVIIMDVKYLKSVSPTEFSRDLGKYRFDISDVFYTNVVKGVFSKIDGYENLNVRDGVTFITAEKGAIDLCEFRAIDKLDLEFSRECVSEGLAKLEDDFSPGYTFFGAVVSLPKYIKSKNYTEEFDFDRDMDQEAS